MRVGHLRRRGAVVVIDQVVSGASNAVPMFVVAHVVSLDEFGLLSVLFGGTVTILAWLRSTFGEATLARQWGEGSATNRAVGEIVIAAIPLSLANSAVYFALGGDWIIALISVVAVPGLVAQDQIRLVAIASDHAAYALASDLVWLIAASLGQAGLALSGFSGTNDYLAWLLAAQLAVLVVAVRRTVRPELSTKSVRLSSLRPHLKTGSANLLGAAASYAIAPITTTLAGPSAAGYLRLAQLMMMPTSFLAALVAPVAMPRIAGDRAGDRVRWFARSFALLAIATSALSLAAIVVAGDVIAPSVEIRILGWTGFGVAVQTTMAVVSTLFYVAVRAGGAIEGYRRTRTTWAVTFVATVLTGAALAGLAGVVVAAALAGALELVLIRGSWERTKAFTLERR